MRVTGYVREAQNVEDGESAFAQSERIRRWASDGGHHLVATCRDERDISGASPGDGFRALLAIAGHGAADAIVVTELAVLSPDAVVQEIAIDRIRSLGLTVVSIDAADRPVLLDETDDPVRRVVRDVIDKVTRFATDFPAPG